MNVIKKGLSTYGMQIFGWATLILGVVLVITVLYYRGARAKDKVNFANVQHTADTALAANKDADEVITRLAISNASLIETIAADQRAAKDAGDRITKLAEQLETKNAENQRIRAQLARENPDVAKYLEGGMPSKLACQLWPEACSNKTPPR